MEWFKAGGFGMFPILAVGMFAIGVGVRAAMAPSARRLALLRSLLSLTVLVSLFAFGMNMWSVNTHLSDPAFVKEAGIAADQMSYVAMAGVTESGQAFTLGGLLATIAAALRAIAEWRNGADAS